MCNRSQQLGRQAHINVQMLIQLAETDRSIATIIQMAPANGGNMSRWAPTTNALIGQSGVSNTANVMQIGNVTNSLMLQIGNMNSDPSGSSGITTGLRYSSSAGDPERQVRHEDHLIRRRNSHHDGSGTGPAASGDSGDGHTTVVQDDNGTTVITQSGDPCQGRGCVEKEPGLNDRLSPQWREHGGCDAEHKCGRHSAGNTRLGFGSRQGR